MKNKAITILRLQSTLSEYFEQSYKIYLDSFPYSERRPLELHDKILKDKRFHWVVFIRNNVAIALFNYWELDTVIHLEHFCVDKSCRGSGIGSEILNSMKEIFRRYNKPVLLEVEPPSLSELAARRKAFYERNEFIYHPEILDWKQPSYHPEEVFSVPLHVMTLDKAMQDSQWAQISEDILKHVYLTTKCELDEMPIHE